MTLHHKNKYVEKRIVNWNCTTFETLLFKYCNCFFFIKGDYLEWTQWTECSKECGFGTRSRSRSHSCNKPDMTENDVCNERRCPYFGGWSNYGPCSTSCGEGKRVCLFQVAYYRYLRTFSNTHLAFRWEQDFALVESPVKVFAWVLPVRMKYVMQVKYTVDLFFIKEGRT